VSIETRLLRLGRGAWASVGLLVLGVAAVYALQQVRVLVVAFVLALFPAALLSPLAVGLRDTRIPSVVSASVLVAALILAFAVPLRLIVPLIAEQVPELVEAASQGLDQIDSVVEWPALPGSPQGPEQLAEGALDSLTEGGAIGQSLVAAGGTVLSVGTGLLLSIVVLFFVLKDGRRLWQGVLDLCPQRRRQAIDEMAGLAWWTLGAYFRGQLLIALFDAVLIGLGLVLLDVPLALPLAVLVFFGGLFPIVGAFLSGLVAVLVALADQGLTTAVLTLALIIAVQQFEGNVIQPVIMSNIVALHPLVIILTVTAGGLVLGVLGAFLAVPFSAIMARLVERARGRPAASGPAHG
jgi:putative heme transporter